jgi:hypothetical protein
VRQTALKDSTDNLEKLTRRMSRGGEKKDTEKKDAEKKDGEKKDTAKKDGQ